MEKFVSRLVEQIEICSRKTKLECVKIDQTPQLLADTENITTCQVCQKSCNGTDRLPHLHHHHLSKRVDYFPVQKVCMRCNIKIVKTSTVAISHEFSERDGYKFISSLKPEYLKQFKIIAKSATECISINFRGRCKFICSHKLLNFPLAELLGRIRDTSYEDPRLGFWPLAQVFKESYHVDLTMPLTPINKDYSEYNSSEKEVRPHSNIF
jgi:hypothetical protein